jgi:long-chain acyl-CoA synthetase
VSLLEHLRVTAANTPQSVCLTDVSGDWTRAQLWGRIEQLADELAQLGVRSLSSSLDNGGDAIALDLAVRMIGAAHLPLPGFFSHAQLAHAQRSAGIEVHVSKQRSARAVHLGAGLFAQPLERSSQPVVIPAATALITYTSGSTGTPKGVCLSAEHLDRVSISIVDALAGHTPNRHLSLLPLSILLEQVAGAYAALLADAQLVIPPLAHTGLLGAAQLDPMLLAECVSRHRPQSLILVPQMLQGWLAALDAGASAPDSLRFCAVGGARVGSQLLAAAARRNLPVFEGYGLSECGSVVCLNRPGANHPGSVGPALGHVQVSVDVDAEILVAGSTFLGYVGEPPRTDDLYRTGDMGSIDEHGRLSIGGRRRNVFITAYGRNVSPEWVESELTQHPAIAQAVVQGEAREFVCAVLVPRRRDASEADLERAVADVNCSLPDYARVSRHVRAAEAFTPANGQLTSNGRVRREQILARYAAAIESLYSPAI